MHIHSRNNPAKFHPDRIWNGGPGGAFLGFIDSGRPNKKNEMKNKLRSDVGSKNSFGIDIEEKFLRFITAINISVIHRQSEKETPYSHSYPHQILTDFKNSFTGTLYKKLYEKLTNLSLGLSDGT